MISDWCYELVHAAGMQVLLYNSASGIKPIIRQTKIIQELLPNLLHPPIFTWNKVLH